MKVNFSLLPDNEISDYIIKVYPNNPNNLKYVIEKNWLVITTQKILKMWYLEWV